MTAEERLFEHIEKKQNSYVKKLKEFVGIAGISASKEHRKLLFKTADWLESEMKRLKISVKKTDNGEHQMEGETVKLPPIVLGSIGNDVKKMTLLVYGHYDVQPAAIEDGWNTEPFELTEIDGKLFGRGSTDDKGPVLAWLQAIEAYQELGLELPVNIKFW